ncbi:protein disulfide-isomerase [Rhodopirellula sp. SWK7]|uniref:protein disulfide-isomerase n=1 Tax=Rhodopirellula sp. SWK7 TaxID=595460 RepID=UPI0002BE4055|nr:protein disulfide-isomerase [Rhodopirellula sp. SWK7]EMI41948.1 protein disulfide-isomerase [Rhodopirellula sp. SWK7]
MISRFAIAFALFGCTLCQADDNGPLLAADGYCIVSTVDEQVWIKGEPGITSDYRGARFLFLNGDAKAAFEKRPEFYAPMLDGNDPVLAADNDKTVAGKREFAMRHKDRTFFFASKKAMMLFDASPEPYYAYAKQRQVIEDKLRALELKRGKSASGP